MRQPLWKLILHVPCWIFFGNFFEKSPATSIKIDQQFICDYFLWFLGYYFFNYIPLELCSATFLEPSLEIILKIYMNFENPSDIALGNSLGNCFRNQSSNFYEMLYYHLQQFIDSLPENSLVI